MHKLPINNERIKIKNNKKGEKILALKMEVFTEEKS